MAVLKLSTFFVIEDGRDFATRHLPQLSSFRPSLQIQLARNYRIDHWLEPAFRQLLSVPLQRLSETEADEIGFFVYRLVTITKAKIDDHRRILAFSPAEVINSVNCKTPERCGNAWRHEWWGSLAKQLLHPEVPLGGQELADQLYKAKLEHMCNGCFRLTMQSMREHNALRREAVFANEAVTELTKWPTDEDIRRSLPDARTLIMTGEGVAV